MLLSYSRNGFSLPFMFHQTQIIWQINSHPLGWPSFLSAADLRELSSQNVGPFSCSFHLSTHAFGAQLYAKSPPLPLATVCFQAYSCSQSLFWKKTFYERCDSILIDWGHVVFLFRIWFISFLMKIWFLFSNYSSFLFAYKFLLYGFPFFGPLLRAYTIHRYSSFFSLQ